MIDIFISILGAFIRFVFIYKLNYSEMGEKYNNDPSSEGIKNNLAGFIGIIIITIVAIIIQFL